MKIKFNSLNAGCGCDKWGDVRVDVERYSRLYNEDTTANILASIEELPFKNKSFKLARCYHTLEHVDNPSKALRELLRVSEKVDVAVPTHNFYCIFLYDLVALPFVSLSAVRTHNLKELFQHLKGIKNWRKRVTAHKWYIKPKGAKLKKWKYLPIPFEYQKIYGG